MCDEAQTEFRRDRTGWTIVILNLLMAANSTLYFTTQLRAGFAGWLAMNSCAPSIAVFAIGFIIGNRMLMAVGAGLMFRFGTLGLFVFGWRGMNLIPQAGHILMTLGVIYFIVRMLRVRSFQEIIAALAVVLVLCYSEWQWGWFARNPRVLERLMEGTLTPDLFK
ncbi:MAG: hypothetical protein NT045_08625 [Candidatus Aureabacteria bacterium]|nr:hypothetical protein [Candidatus Auribacterota bacterium]